MEWEDDKERESGRGKNGERYEFATIDVLKNDMKYKHSTKGTNDFLRGSNHFRNSISHGEVLH